MLGGDEFNDLDPDESIDQIMRQTAPQAEPPYEVIVETLDPLQQLLAHVSEDDEQSELRD